MVETEEHPYCPEIQIETEASLQRSSSSDSVGLTYIVNLEQYILNEEKAQKSSKIITGIDDIKNVETQNVSNNTTQTLIIRMDDSHKPLAQLSYCGPAKYNCDSSVPLPVYTILMA